MNLHELGILIVHTLKQAAGTDVALLVRVDTRRPESWCKAGDRGRTMAETACVRLMQSQAEKGFAKADYFLYTTETPSDMCLGMSRRCHVTAIVFLEGSKIKFRTWQDVGGASRALIPEMKEMIAGMWAAEGPWPGIEAELRSRIPGIEQTIRNQIAPAWAIWLRALSNVREVAFVWLTLPHNRELQPVAAPRFRGVTRQRAHTRPNTPIRDRIYISLTFALLDCARTRANRQNPALAGQQIAAVLVGPDGRLLAWGVNTNSSNVTRHGETNCIQTYFRETNQPIPDGSTLYTTLQSCEMCSGMLVTVARNLRVVYGAPDGGIGQTALMKGLNGCREERFPGSHCNPVARAEFQRIAALVIQRNYDERIAAAVDTATQAYTAAHPRPVPPPGANGDAKKAANLAYQSQVRAFTARWTALMRARHATVAAGMNQNPLPDAITNALSHPASMNNIAGYRRFYDDLGTMMLCRRQFRPDADWMGFTREELRRIVERDEARFPILRTMIESDFDAWDEGNQLLRAVQVSALADQ